MKYEMTLKNEPFEKIKLGLKDIEMRLFDEKRQILKIGDFINFTNLSNNEKITTEILNIKIFNDFKELYSFYDKSRLGYFDNEECSYKDMDNYYPPEKQRQYKVVAIQLKLV